MYIEGLAGDWDEEKLKENCKQYGEITEIKLLQGLGKKRKDVGFISFTSRESALACIEGINNAQIGQGKVEVMSNLLTGFGKCFHYHIFLTHNPTAFASHVLYF